MNDIVKRLRERRVTRWVHNTGETPRAEGYSTDTECQEAAAEIERLREVLQMLADQHSGEVCSTKRSDCMAAIASAALDA